jgi:hypothetical protein
VTEAELFAVAWETVKVILPPIATFFVGRYSKNIETMTGDLAERTKEFRALVVSIRDAGVKYWSEVARGGSIDLEEDLVRQLRRLNRMRVLCAIVSRGYRSERMRELESRFDMAVTDGTFGNHDRKADPNKVRLIRYIADDLDFAAMEARRADLFLLPWRR